MFELSPRDNAPDAVAPGPPQGSIPDLEEELARALAEPGSAPPPLAAREKSFSDGLSDLLGKPKSRKRKDVPGQQTEPDAVPGPETGLETTPVALPSPEPVAEPETVVAETDESIANSDLPVGTPVAIPAEAAGDAVAPEPEVAEVDMAETTHSADELTEADLMVAPPPAPVLPSRKVLGTYNAGGRTYSMYADGSVEAVTELGVERFSSMDELRRHLVKAWVAKIYPDFSGVFANCNADRLTCRHFGDISLGLSYRMVCRFDCATAAPLLQLNSTICGCIRWIFGLPNGFFKPKKLRKSLI
jgi:hypothetical protein